MSSDNAIKFSVDRLPPLTVVLALLGQTVALVWYGANWQDKVNNRIEWLERAEVQKVSHETRLVKLEEAIPFIKEALQDLKTKGK